MEWLPANISLTVISDRTTTIRASVDDVQYTLMITIALVFLVVSLFMRRLMPTIAAAVTVPCRSRHARRHVVHGLHAGHFSLMALTISVGFVVDDAIVMIENIVRHRERGLDAMRAALIGSRQIGFTVMSISISLVAVFIPLIFMGGVMGRLFHEFAMTMAMAIGVSAVVSLTLTPMICAQYMREDLRTPPRNAILARFDRMLERVFNSAQRFYAATLGWALEHRVFMLLVTLATVVLTVRLYTVLPKGFLPLQDTGIITGSTLASPDISFQAMEERQRAAVDVILRDPAVAGLVPMSGSGRLDSLNRGPLTVSLKPLSNVAFRPRR